MFYSRKMYYQQLENFILTQDHPCVMAQAAFKHEHVHLGLYGKIESTAHSNELYSDLQSYLDAYNWEDAHFNTFIAAFPHSETLNEKDFEKALWNQLKQLHSMDDHPWDDSVSDDPDDHNFSFSVLGKAFYIVGMHPNSGRKARQSPFPILVFNLHHQFERLREHGTYKTTRNTIRKRDKELQGSINPMLTDFGQGKEALQYSGRKVGPNWKCPFHSKNSQ